MNSFDILTPSTPIHKPYLLEASAGTGKTFSIENLIARLILEEDPFLKDAISIDKILVVTFTRAATRDLKERVQENLRKVRYALKGRMENSPWGYVNAILNAGDAEIRKAIRRVEQALFAFDQAQIFTIHAFCARMLYDFGFEAGILIDREEEQLSNSHLIRIIRDFFRTGLHPEVYSPEQVKILLNHYKKNMDQLEEALLFQMKRGFAIAEIDPFFIDFEAFRKIMGRLVAEDSFSGSRLREDFERQKGSYKVPKIAKNQKDFHQKMEEFAALFDKKTWEASDFDSLIKEGVYPIEAFQVENLKKNKKKPLNEDLHYPNLPEILSKELKPLVEKAACPFTILARMAKDCRTMMRRYCSEEEKFRFDDFLIAMEESLKRPSFADKVRKKYRAAIIDEFQDTDPVQWKIFDALFLKESNPHFYLYLVGDPKQSIYAFRQADIYTYLSAAEAIGEKNQASLDCNFRSTPELVQALNHLFKSAPRFLTLPRVGGALDYPEVKASNRLKGLSIEDGKGSVHFWLADGKEQLSIEEIEDKMIFPFVAEEIFKLNHSFAQPMESIAILVKDRWQSERIASFLRQKGLPVAVQKQTLLHESSALPALKEMLRAFSKPRDESSLKTALGGPLFGWTHAEVRTLSNLVELEKVLTKIHRLRSLFFKEGFGSFYNAFLNTSWEAGGKTVLEKMLAQEGGEELYHECMQIVEILIEHHARTSASFDGLLLYLDDFKQMAFDENEEMKKQLDVTLKAIHILTLHMSKGLEYDIIFPLGLCKRFPLPDRLFPFPQGEEIVISPAINKNSPAYLQYCDESDAEKMRQLYVALTRAKKRVYIPAIFSSSSQVEERGTASLMELFAAKIERPEADSEELYRTIQGNAGQNFSQFLERISKEADISYEWLEEQNFKSGLCLNQKKALLIPPSPSTLPGRPLFIHSFTSLANSSKWRDQKEADHPPADFGIDERTLHTLPAGAETGTLLHLILEKIPLKEVFKVASPLEMSKWVSPYLKNSPFKDWEQVICEMIYNALNVSFNGFSFKQIDPKLCFREMEFLYQSSNQSITDIPNEEGFVRGVIDLLFEHEGKYYLVDWKSNWLGPSKEHYQERVASQYMQKSQYPLQAAIYKNALKKFLRIFDEEMFASRFGGTFYVFLRGLDPFYNSKSGVVYLPYAYTN